MPFPREGVLLEAPVALGIGVKVIHKILWRKVQCLGCRWFPATTNCLPLLCEEVNCVLAGGLLLGGRYHSERSQGFPSFEGPLRGIGRMGRFCHGSCQVIQVQLSPGLVLHIHHVVPILMVEVNPPLCLGVVKFEDAHLIPHCLPDFLYHVSPECRCLPWFLWSSLPGIGAGPWGTPTGTHSPGQTLGSCAR